MRVKAEWDSLKEVMIHRPGIEIEYAMLAPRPFLFERPFNTELAVREHQSLENTLKENGVRVRVLRNTVVEKSYESETFRKELEKKVLSIVRYFGTIESSEKAQKEFLKNLEVIDPNTLFHILTLEPSIDLKKEEDDAVDYPTVYSNIPLANLYFMRDQQAVGPGGVIVGNMKKRQRMKEPEITQFVLSKAFSETSLKRISGESVFEGGDFMPVKDFGLIGIGPRSNFEGAMDAISSGILDYDEIGIVDNPVYDFMENSRDTMVNMHLDTYFNIAGDGIAVTSVELAKKATLTLYSRQSKGKYEKTGTTTLYDYLKQKGFNFINLRISEQMSYSSNFLTLSDRKIMAVNVEKVLGKLLSENVFDKTLKEHITKDLDMNGRDNLFPQKKEMREYGIDNITMELSELTGGYGGAHCMTASLNR